MNIRNTITTYPFLTMFTNIEKKSFSNMAKHINVSDNTISRILRPGKESLLACKDIAKSIFRKQKTLMVVIDETTIKKQYAQLMEGTGFHFDTKTNSCNNAYKLMVSAITDGKHTVPIDAAFTFGKEFYENSSTAREVAVNFYIKNAQALFSNTRIIAALDGAFASVNYLKWCLANAIASVVRMHSNRTVEYKGKKQKIREIKELRPKGRQMFRTISVIWQGLPLYITAVRRIDRHGCETIVYQASTFLALPKKHAQAYKNRWGIEKLFRSAKQTLGLQECFSRKIKTQFDHTCAVLLAYAITQQQMKNGYYKNPESVARALEKQKQHILLKGISSLDQIFGNIYA